MFGKPPVALLLAFLLCGLCGLVSASPTESSSRGLVALSGTWQFFPDYFGKGEEYGWHTAETDAANWDTVELPHIWNLEPRYEYTGPAWYRRTFVAPVLKPGEHARLRFGAVFYKATVWLNGKFLGEHEGGYTAFDLDATSALKRGEDNLLVVRVDNSWSTQTLPGARNGNTPRELTYPWWNYGGIKKPVYLELAAPMFVANQKIVAVPDLANGTASVSVKVWLRNTSNRAESRRLRVRLRRPGAWDSAGTAETTVSVPAASTAVSELSIDLPAGAVDLWDVDHPRLYESLAQVFEGNAAEPGDSHLSRFGIRKVEISGARLLLNGEPISFGGANRSADHPQFGSMETEEVVDLDLSLMKSANMGLARILHYPCSPALLDWADEHGFLIIAEAGNWGLREPELNSEVIRAKWKQQTREMMEQGWNHPSVIAWSMGNEYQSDSPAGVRWTRDMLAFVKELDDSRLRTFVSLGGMIFSKVPPEESSFHYVDFLCVNIYGNGRLGEAMETLHRTWPEKPVLVSEFGWREDTAPSEEWRAQQFREALTILRKYPFVIGASVWAWNDYRSRHYGTNTDGYRHWGLVDRNREARGAYYALREEFSPALLSQVSVDRKPQGLSATFAVRVQVQARGDFPSRTLRDFEVHVVLVKEDDETYKTIKQRLPDLRPGESAELLIPVSPFDISAVPELRVELRQPTGFLAIERSIQLKESRDQ